mmetsp:Transcript_3676/g.16141  ORF Transcript_3676/g.16141 Transcript_3676/m.16141 type:complete len:205 (-) Transcript_3676:1141-1755(-)
MSGSAPLPRRERVLVVPPVHVASPPSDPASHRRRPDALCPDGIVEGERQDALLLLEEHRGTPVRQVGGVDAAVGAARVADVPAGVHGDAPYRAVVRAVHRLHAPLLPEVPQPQRVIARAREAQATVAAQRRAPDVAGMAPELTNPRTGATVPHPDDVPGASGHERVTGVVQRQRVRRLLLALGVDDQIRRRRHPGSTRTGSVRA